MIHLKPNPIMTLYLFVTYPAVSSTDWRWTLAASLHGDPRQNHSSGLHWTGALFGRPEDVPPVRRHGAHIGPNGRDPTLQCSAECLHHPALESGYVLKKDESHHQGRVEDNQSITCWFGAWNRIKIQTPVPHHLTYTDRQTHLSLWLLSLNPFRVSKGQEK